MDSTRSDLTYSDGIAGSRTMLAVEANPDALQRRLPDGWELAPYTGDDLRGTSLRGANLLVPFHEVHAVHTADGPATGLSQLSYVAFVSQARHRDTGTLAHMHLHAYTEDPDSVPGKYADSVLAEVTRSQRFTKKRRGETRVQESFSAVADSGEVHLTLGYEQGGAVMWVTAEQPNLELQAAANPDIVRWYQEDQVIDLVRSVPMGIDKVGELELTVTGELEDVFDGHRSVAVVIQRPYLRRVYVPVAEPVA
ncbi:MAG: hypothetical protein ACRDT4_09650 [Micromonosporaceae bacterium]